MKRYGVATLVAFSLVVIAPNAIAGEGDDVISSFKEMSGDALALATGFGPMAESTTQEVSAVTLSYFFDLPQDSIAFTGGPALSFSRFPEGIPVMSDPAISNGLAVLVKLRDGNGNMVGFASELEVFPEQSQEGFGSKDVVWDTVWTLMIPGRGSLYLVQQEHSGDLARQTIAAARESGQDWVGEKSMTTTVGPNPDGTGAVLAGTGKFSDATGSFVEIVNMHRVTPDGNMTMTGELRLTLDKK